MNFILKWRGRIFRWYCIYWWRKNTVSYELTLPADELFTKVHGEIVLHYDIYTNKNIILLKSISPEELFLEGHATELNAYKGVMISKENADKDMFKINLLDLLNK